MKIEFEIDDMELQKAITDILAKKILSEFSAEGRIMNKYGISDAVKEIVYTQKEELLEKCVKRATAELVKKGLPRVLDKINTNE